MGNILDSFKKFQISTFELSFKQIFNIFGYKEIAKSQSFIIFGKENDYYILFSNSKSNTLNCLRIYDQKLYNKVSLFFILSPSISPENISKYVTKTQIDEEFPKTQITEEIALSKFLRLKPLFDRPLSDFPFLQNFHKFLSKDFVDNNLFSNSDTLNNFISLPLFEQQSSSESPDSYKNCNFVDFNMDKLQLRINSYNGYWHSSIPHELEKVVLIFSPFSLLLLQEQELTYKYQVMPNPIFEYNNYSSISLMVSKFNCKINLLYCIDDFYTIESLKNILHFISIYINQFRDIYTSYSSNNEQSVFSFIKYDPKFYKISAFQNFFTGLNDDLSQVYSLTDKESQSYKEFYQPFLFDISNYKIKSEDNNQVFTFTFINKKETLKVFINQLINFMALGDILSLNSNSLNDISQVDFME